MWKQKNFWSDAKEKRRMFERNERNANLEICLSEEEEEILRVVAEEVYSRAIFGRGCRNTFQQNADTKMVAMKCKNRAQYEPPTQAVQESSCSN